MSASTIEWNLAFARDEVVAGLEKLLAQAGYVYTRTDADAETRFQAARSQGSLVMVVRPLPVQPPGRSPSHGIGGDLHGLERRGRRSLSLPADSRVFARRRLN